MKRPLSLLVGLAVVGLFVAGCQETTIAEEESSGSPVVYAVNYPLFYIAERLGGELISLKASVPAGVDPARSMPRDETLVSMQSADLILRNGATFAKWWEQVSMPRSIAWDTTADHADSLIVIKDAVVHTHGDGKTHSHAGYATTTWLDFDLAARQAASVKEALIKLIPDSAEVITGNAEELIVDLRALDAEMIEIGFSLGEKPLFASHPGYEYFAKRYGTRVENFHWDGDVRIDAKAEAALIEKLGEVKAEAMLWQSPPLAENIALLEKHGIRSVVFQPATNRPEDGRDFLDVMSANIGGLKALLD
ncbi:MAG: metal ABC transporter substrate-binding protein [Verrucomicrobiota bacterium]